MADNGPELSPTRRSLLRSAGGAAALTLSGTSVEEVRASGALDELQTDPHTRDVFRSIVDAIVPRTPALAEELGTEHEAGALDAEAEKYIIWDFDHFQEVRAETVTRASPSRFETEFTPDVVNAFVETDSLVSDVLDVSPDFGTLERFAVTVTNVPEEGPVDLDVVVETANGGIHEVMQNYPYAEGLAVVFELVAIEFVARGGNEQQPAVAREKFPAGGLFVRLAPRDRLRCLRSIIDGGMTDRLDDTIDTLLPTVGVLKFAVMGVFGMTTLGYYSEWPGYGETKTATPNERELQIPPGEVVSREQTGYPGPRPGYPAHRGFEVQAFRDNDWGDSS